MIYNNLILKTVKGAMLAGYLKVTQTFKLLK